MSEKLAKHGRELMNNAVGAVIIAALLLLGWGVWNQLSGKPHHFPTRLRIKVMEQTPPPPPRPPPKFEKQPDISKEQNEIKVEQPKQAPPQTSPELKMEGPVGNGPSAFSAGKITSDDLSKLGTRGNEVNGGNEGNGRFNQFDNYANLLKEDMQRYLTKYKALQQRNYTVDVRIWVTGGGELKRFELIGSTGDSETDEAIKQAISSLSGFDQPPPANMPQPIWLRIVTAY